MKKLITILALLGFAHSAFADGAEFSHDGEFRLRYGNVKNDNTNATDGFTEQRFKWGTTFRAGEKFTGRLSVNVNSDWGESTKASDQFATDTSDATLVVNEAWGAWMASDQLMYRFGRGCFTLADGSVIGCNEWEPNQKAFDGGLITYDAEFVKTSFFGVQGVEINNAGTLPDDDVFFLGVSFDFKTLPEFLKTANLHYLSVANQGYDYQNKKYDKNASGTQSRYGLTLGGDMVGVDYKLTYAAMSSSPDLSGAPKQSGSMIDAEVGYSMPDMRNFRVWFGYHTDSGDDSSTTDSEKYESFHENVHEYAGEMDIFGFGNLTYMNVGLALDLMENTNLKLAYYNFSATDKDGSTDVNILSSFYSYSGLGTRQSGQDALGTEIDLSVSHKYSDNFMITARYGQFTPGDAYTITDSISLFFLEGKMTF
ncbi:MAG: hypothetical protein D6797_09455 [Bdellovibrio sp.]|nr:MAG: hypothetical protein D6797_09455 [Bdellovibrio sp.]